MNESPATAAPDAPQQPAACTKPPVRRGFLKTLFLWVLRTILLFILLLSLLLLWFSYSPPDLSPYADEMAAWFSKRFRHEIHFSRIQLLVAPLPSVLVTQVEGRSPGGSETSFKAEEMMVRFSPVAWAKGLGWPVEMVIRQPALVMRRDREGRLHLGRVASQEETGGSVDPSPPSLSIFQNITVVDGSVLFLDSFGSSTLPTRLFLEGLNVNSVRSRKGLWQIEGGLRFTVGGRPVPVQLFAQRQPGSPWTFKAWSEPFRPSRLSGALRLAAVDLPVRLEMSGQFSQESAIRADWKVSGGEGAIDLTPLFRWPMPVRSLEAQGVMEGVDGLWGLSVNHFTTTTEEGRASGRFTLMGLGGDNPVLDLEAEAENEPADKAPFYYPAAIMAPPLLNWLDDSIKGGRVRKATARIHGPVKQIPFHKERHSLPSEVIFRIEGDVEGTSLTYFPGLPPIADLSTHLIFDRASMFAQVHSGRIEKSRRVRGTVSIKDMTVDPTVVVDARADAHLPTVWQEIIAAKPLGWDEKMRLSGSKVSGVGDFHLNLTLPIKNLDETLYSGTILFSEAGFHPPFLPVGLKKIQGKLLFDQRSVRFERLKGRLGEQALEASLRADDYRDGERAKLRIDISTRAEERWLATWLAPLVGEGGELAGSVPLRLTLKNSAQSVGFDLEAVADARALKALSQVGWRMPPDERSRVHGKGMLDWSGRLHITQLEATLGNVKASGKGALRFVDGGAVAEGFTIRFDGILDEKSLEHWMNPLLGEGGQVKGKTPVRVTFTNRSGEPDVTHLNLLVRGDNLAGQGRLGWRKEAGQPGKIEASGLFKKGEEFLVEDIQVNLGNLSATGAGEWNWVGKQGRVFFSELHWDESQGQLETTYDGRWMVDLNLKQWDLRRVLQKAPQAVVAAKKVRQRDVQKEREAPWSVILSLSAQKVLLANQVEGREMTIGALVEPDEFRIQSLRMYLPEKKVLDGQGALSWLDHFGYGRYEGSVWLHTEDVGSLIKGLGWHEGLSGGEGSLEMKLSGLLPSGERFPKFLSGHGRLRAQEGVVRQFRTLSRLLGFLSIKDLPDLLAGDRPDLSEEGFYYKEVNGEFTLKDGLLTTEKVALTGPSMTLNVGGAVDLPEERLSLQVSARPLQAIDGVLSHVPLLGQLVVGKRNTLLETQFDINGTFDEPQVELNTMNSLAPGVVHDILDLSRKLLQKRPEAENSGGVEEND